MTINKASHIYKLFSQIIESNIQSSFSRLSLNPGGAIIILGDIGGISHDVLKYLIFYVHYF